MKIFHIAALSENQVIAKAGAIPWMIREDLQRFKTLTAGHPIIMGSATFESLKRQPLKGRVNIVLSRKDTVMFEGRPFSYEEYGVPVAGGQVLAFEVKGTKVIYARSVEDALAYCEGSFEVYIIGGGEIYRDTLEIAHELRLTIVHQDIETEGPPCVFYPEIDDTVWYPSYTEAGEGHSYVDYVRRPVS